jgi:hypothetical protein
MKAFHLIAILLVFCTCRKKPPDQPVPNIPPDTRLFIEGEIDTTGARQTLCWYGNDPDGEVVGFYWAIDDTSLKNWIEKNCSTFVFSSADTPIIHIFYVWAVDNEGEADTSPAFLILPVINTPPTVNFVENSLPPDTTFPVASFYWEGHDEDGDETIEGYYWRLDTDPDTLGNFVDASQTHITIYDIQPGERIFTVRALDEAGALSPPLQDTFYVKEVVGDILLVDDEIGDDGGSFYRNFLENQGFLYSEWRIEYGLPYSSQDVYTIINELGFNTIIWYTGDSSHFSGAQGALTKYLDDGKNLLLISPSILDLPLSDFNRNYLHVGELTQPERFLIPIWPLIAQVSPYPDTLTLSVSIIAHVDGFEPDSLSEALYRCYESTVWDSAAVALRYPKESENANLIFFSIPLHMVNGLDNIDDLLYHILTEEFGISKF